MRIKKKKLNTLQKHQLRMAKETLNMPSAILGVMGGMTKLEAKRIKKRIENYQKGD